MLTECQDRLRNNSYSMSSIKAVLLLIDKSFLKKQPSGANLQNKFS